MSFTLFLVLQIVRYEIFLFFLQALLPAFLYYASYTLLGLSLNNDPLKQYYQKSNYETDQISNNGGKQ